jgi:hypothetical protein
MNIRRKRMIKLEHVITLLYVFDLGNSTAENDPLLETAKIETQEFYDLYFKDRIDIVKGIKGAGKTAIYRLCSFLEKYSIEKSKLYLIFGIEASGDPIFRLYQKEFELFSEMEFENFWNIYFIALIYNLIHTKTELKELFKSRLGEIDGILSGIGLKFSKKGFSLKESISSIQKLFNNNKMKIGLQAEIDSQNPSVMKISPVVEIDPIEQKMLSQKPIYIADFKNQLSSIVSESGIRIWIMIDRLDEVFLHRSEIEKKGLRSLLKASYNFSNPSLRIKIFLRDDIIEYLAADGFTALTHITDRSSQTISWSKDELLYLVTKRISAIKTLKEYYRIDEDKLAKDKKYRSSVFDQVFPLKIGKMNTFDWLYQNCSDSNGIVTPRDIIDFFKCAKAEQLKRFRLDPKEQENLIDEDSFKAALGQLSKHKKETFLFAEFPHLKDAFLKFEGTSSEYDEESIKKLLGVEYKKIIEDLRAIGFMKYDPRNKTYKIPPVWRKSLSIRRKKEMSGK